ncbi:hypothetical protein PHYSODRAFT_284710 [Phytophthora sojae]|uniref:Uncharacterized protein n=1 Tax=Phytophthora sojae (strain P6497) TaxID=1094619 RepID=G4YWM1_PHYSP|nr:hypothetical protein PHYSODRAFT_284710 [Phytophthora sojae]EGZ23202.1 hypothetical protein PHYSODRAFT_284710 [Phytophthora sojae]|eukprot:XP_009518490.1 hypothetical protein PHYSODRAFT_284710 [Phytophthora sojae]
MELLADLDPEGDSLTAVTAKMEMPAHYAAHYGSAREVETLLLCLTRALGDLEELVELGAANPLNVGDGSDRTSLYITGTASILTEDGGFERSIGDRDEKVRLLLDHGGQVFPLSILTQTLTATGSRIVLLTPEIKLCMEMWLLEIGRGLENYPVGPHDEENCESEASTEFFVHWAANAVVDGGVSMMILMVMVNAGYGYDVLPLLLDLPLCPGGFSEFLRRLAKLARHGSRSSLLLQLHDELRAAWEATAEVFVRRKS